MRLNRLLPTYFVFKDLGTSGLLVIIATIYLLTRPLKKMESLLFGEFSDVRASSSR